MMKKYTWFWQLTFIVALANSHLVQASISSFVTDETNYADDPLNSKARAQAFQFKPVPICKGCNYSITGHGLSAEHECLDCEFKTHPRRFQGCIFCREPLKINVLPVEEDNACVNCRFGFEDWVVKQFMDSPYFISKYYTSLGRDYYPNLTTADFMDLKAYEVAIDKEYEVYKNALNASEHEYAACAKEYVEAVKISQNLLQKAYVDAKPQFEEYQKQCQNNRYFLSIRVREAGREAFAQHKRVGFIVGQSKSELICQSKKAWKGFYIGTSETGHEWSSENIVYKSRDSSDTDKVTAAWIKKVELWNKDYQNWPNDSYNKQIKLWNAASQEWVDNPYFDNPTPPSDASYIIKFLQQYALWNIDTYVPSATISIVGMRAVKK